MIAQNGFVAKNRLMYYRVVYLCRFSLCVCVCVCTFSFHLMWTNDYIMHLPPHNCQSLWLCGLIRKADFKFWKSFLYVTLRYVYMLFRFVCNSLSLLSSLNLVCCSKSHQQVQFFCRFERVRRRGAEKKKRQCLIYFDLCCCVWRPAY